MKKLLFFIVVTIVINVASAQPKPKTSTTNPKPNTSNPKTTTSNSQSDIPSVIIKVNIPTTIEVS